MTEAAWVWMRSGEKNSDERPIPRPKALASTGRETVVIAAVTDSIYWATKEDAATPALYG